MALTINLKTTIATTIFYIDFQLIKNYLIQPQTIHYNVQLPNIVTIPTMLTNNAVLNIPKTLFAIPLTLIIQILVQNLALPTLDRH